MGEDMKRQQASAAGGEGVGAGRAVDSAAQSTASTRESAAPPEAATQAAASAGQSESAQAEPPGGTAPPESAASRREWLSELEEQSKRRQQAFMDGIAAKLGRPRQLERPVQPRRGAPAFWREFQWSPEERAAKLREHFEAAGGKLAELPDLEAAGRFIAEQAREMKARRILRQDEAELARLGLEPALEPEGCEVRVWNEDGAGRESWLPRAAEADFGVVLADGAAAYTGSVCVRSAPHKGRSVSLLPTALFVVLPRERLATRLGELLLPLDEAGREAMPAGVHFISGPSRSADIENDLTIGVHGPGIVTILLIG